MIHNISAEAMNSIKASLLDCFTDFISIANKERDIIYFNPAAYRMMGYGPDERPDIRRTEELHTTGADEIARTQIQPAVFANGFWRGISYIKHKDGSPITVEMTVFPLYVQNGDEYGTVAIMRDVDELSKLNEQLRKSTETFQQVLDSARIGIVLINMETNEIEMANSFTKELLQLEEASLVGRKCYDVLCHRSLDMCPHVNQSDQFLLSERFIERKDGSFIPIIKTGTRINIGSTKYLIDTFVDISIQKGLEKNLQEAKMAAEAANSSKSEFLSRMSHEMRTPLNAVIGMTQIAEKTNDAIKLKEYIQTIKLSSNYLLELINDVLDMSKIEEGKLELNIEPFSMADLTRKIDLLISPKAAEKKIDFRINTDENVPHSLVGDSLRLAQVLLNFLSNAVKFTPAEGTIGLDITQLSSDSRHAQLRFAVRDSGIGISAEQLEKLFSPFTQADSSITRKFGGTGLGLAISKRLINLMNSDIGVTSEYGKGSTFSFDISLPVSSNENVADLVDEQLDFANANGIFEGKKILVVDDVEINRMIVGAFLEETGMAVDEAGDGKDAVEKASKTLYDLILMDIQMPVMDGYEATETIRAMPAPYSAVPIVAMSANVFKEDVQRSLNMGMHAHIGKPVDANNMLNVIYRLIKGADDPNASEGTNLDASNRISLRRDILATDYDVGQFDFHQALKNVNAEYEKLEILCGDFIQGNSFQVISGAMKRQDFSTALEKLMLFIENAELLAMKALAAFAKNVMECIKLQNYDFAVMYFNDVEQWYIKACEIIRGLQAEALSTAN